MKIIYTDIVKHLKKPNEYYLNKQICYTDDCIMGNLNNLVIQNQPKTISTFVHVFWSKPSFKQNFKWDIFGQYEITLALSALSLACLKEFGQKVILITDTKGKELLGDLPYDEIHTILDDYEIPKKFWAAGKIAALEYLPTDITLIDNDLFIYDGNLIDKINKNERVCCVRECGLLGLQEFKPGIQKVPWLATKNLQNSSQTSILKVNNKFLNQIFIDSYKEIVKILTYSNGELKEGLTDNKTPDLIAEQFNFHCLCDPIPIIEGWFGPYIQGLCHLLSHAKYFKLPMVLEKLQKLFPEYYNIVINKWKELDFEVIIE